MKALPGRDGRKLEALVDGTTVVEGTVREVARSNGRPLLVIEPSYLRAGFVRVTRSGMIRVRVRAEQERESDAALADLPADARLDPSGFCEVWLDGRLVAMART